MSCQQDVHIAFFFDGGNTKKSQIFLGNSEIRKIVNQNKQEVVFFLRVTV
jgi:hypothetical protein